MLLRHQSQSLVRLRLFLRRWLRLGGMLNSRCPRRIGATSGHPIIVAAWAVGVRVRDHRAQKGDATQKPHYDHQFLHGSPTDCLERDQRQSAGAWHNAKAVGRASNKLAPAQTRGQRRRPAPPPLSRADHAFDHQRAIPSHCKIDGPRQRGSYPFCSRGTTGAWHGPSPRPNCSTYGPPRLALPGHRRLCAPQRLSTTERTLLGSPPRASTIRNSSRTSIRR